MIKPSFLMLVLVYPVYFRRP